MATAEAQPAPHTPMMAQYHGAEGRGAAIACCSTAWATSSSCSSRMRRSPPPTLDIALTARGEHDGGDPDVRRAGACRRRLSRPADPRRAPRRDRRTGRDARAGQEGAADRRRWSRATIIRLVTAGTLTEETLLDSRSANWLVGAGRSGRADRHRRGATSRPAASSWRRVPPPALDAELARLGAGGSGRGRRRPKSARTTR